ncbi:zinc ribbon domain-containing protein, partial [Streptomyces longwoodensis]|uniref:zinc ribbon domain-containing protein n=1 Tax=Streptomyces longwoodensis TaxID=68231 RepID=UPI0033D724A8
MSQMPPQAALSKCPSCAEPLESGDRFCGACGYDLSAVPPPPPDHPTLAMNGAVLPDAPQGPPTTAAEPLPAHAPAPQAPAAAAVPPAPAAAP